MRIINKIAIITGFLGFCFMGQMSVFAAVVPPNYTLIPSPPENKVDYQGGTTGGVTLKNIILVIVLCIIIGLTIYF
jgi:hypothetical protein